VWVTSSPDWGEDWCHRNFWIPAEQGKPGFWATTYKTIDNPILDPAEIELDRDTMPPELFRREYEASIEFPTGTIYGEVIAKADASDDDVRAWLPEWPHIDPSRTSICGLDPGTDHPFAAVLIVVTPNGLVQVSEYEERGKPYIAHATSIKGMLRGESGLTPRFAIDRSQAQAAIELAQHGIYAQAAENAVEAGVQRVFSWMAAGKFRIARSRCPKTLKELRQYRYADLPEGKKGLPQGVQVFKKDDDLCDALRYALMLWPELPVKHDPFEKDKAKRDLALLSPTARKEIERNAPPEETPDGLIRVTDDFSPIYSDVQPLGNTTLGDFYA
jgi:hypothetical protein